MFRNPHTLHHEEIEHQLGLKYLDTILDSFDALFKTLTDISETRYLFQKLFDSAVPRFTPESADTISRITLRLSVGLPPLPEKEMDISEFSGSLSHLLKHKTRSIGVIEDLDDKA